jgi:hypothetical protein
VVVSPAVGKPRRICVLCRHDYLAYTFSENELFALAPRTVNEISRRLSLEAIS